MNARRGQGSLNAGVLAVTLAFSTGSLFAQKTVPDAQIESNVLRQLATAPELSTQNNLRHGYSVGCDPYRGTGREGIKSGSSG